MAESRVSPHSPAAVIAAAAAAGGAYLAAIAAGVPARDDPAAPAARGADLPSRPPGAEVLSS